MQAWFSGRMSFNPLKRILLTKRPSDPPEANQTSHPLKPTSEGPAPACEEPSIDEVEALLAQGLRSADSHPAGDNAAFLELIDEMVGQSDGSVFIDPKNTSEDPASVGMEAPESAKTLPEDIGLPIRTGISRRRSRRQVAPDAIAVSTSAGTHGARRPSTTVSTNGVESRKKCSHLQVGAERIVNLMRSGTMPASRVRSAISRSNQKRAEVIERSKRVNDSFLSFGTACAAQEPQNSAHATNGLMLNQPEVMRKAPMTGAQRVSRLEQNVIAAKQEWEAQYRVLMMVENGVGTHAASDSLDGRHIQHKEAVDVAAQNVLEASGDLLIAQVEVGMAKLPGDQIYYYHDDRAKLQGPYKATQLSKLAKLGVMPSTCMVLIDLAQVKGVSVRAPAQTLLRLIEDPENICRPTDNPPSSTQSGHATNKSIPGGNGSADRERDRQFGNQGRGSGRGSGTGLRDSQRTRFAAKQRVECQQYSSDNRGNRSGTGRWQDSGARQSEAISNGRNKEDAQKNALIAFEEEKALEVYSFEDSEGEICGPFSFIELQEKFSRGAISEPLLLMYDTDYGTTVLSVAQLFRNMTQRHEELLAARNPASRAIETLISAGQLLRSKSPPKPAASEAMPGTCIETVDACQANSPALAADVPDHLAAAGCMISIAAGARSADDWAPTTAEAPLDTAEPTLHPSQTALGAKAGALESAEEVVSNLPSWMNSIGYSAAPPEGYGAAPAVASGAPQVPALGQGLAWEASQVERGGRTAGMQAHGASTLDLSMDIEGNEGGTQPASLLELPSGFNSFEDLLHHVAENQMEPIKQRMLRTQGSQRPALMARLDFKALRALAEAPVHMADNAIRTFISLNYEPQDASIEFLRCLTEQDTHTLFL